MSDEHSGRGRTGDSNPSEGHSEDDRSGLAKAMGRASEASTVAFTIGLCFLMGYGLDRLLGTSPVAAVIGLILGLITGFWQLVQLAGRISSDAPRQADSARKADTEDGSPHSGSL